MQITIIQKVMSILKFILEKSSSDPKLTLTLTMPIKSSKTRTITMIKIKILNGLKAHSKCTILKSKKSFTSIKVTTITFLLIYQIFRWKMIPTNLKRILLLIIFL